MIYIYIYIYIHILSLYVSYNKKIFLCIIFYHTSNLMFFTRTSSLSPAGDDTLGAIRTSSLSPTSDDALDAAGPCRKVATTQKTVWAYIYISKYIDIYTNIY